MADAPDCSLSEDGAAVRGVGMVILVGLLVVGNCGVVLGAAEGRDLAVERFAKSRDGDVVDEDHRASCIVGWLSFLERPHDGLVLDLRIEVINVHRPVSPEMIAELPDVARDVRASRPRAACFRVEP